MSAEEVKVPDIGDFEDVPVVEVLVTAGDEVEAEAPLLVLESDKASMEIPSPQAGTVAEVRVAIGDTVSEGTVIATLQAGDRGDGGDGEGDGVVAHSDAGAVVEEERASKSDASTETDGAASGGGGSREAPPEPASAGTSDPSSDAGRAGGKGPVYASPSVRRLARQRGIDLTTVTGSGRKGRIVPEDLDRPARQEAAPAAEDGTG
ncbi:MAG TPA: biotin/lipoyl-containing protein, partial [Solirubrobacteraceae bacterium]|nr:biotin/lipoyl-containing protein [Solirubrobacteraceae bacterium]